MNHNLNVLFIDESQSNVCLGYLETIHTINNAFELAKLLDEITSNASSSGNFKEVVFDTPILIK